MGAGRSSTVPLFSFFLLMYCLSSAAQVLQGCSGFLAAIVTRAANTCERQSVCHSSVLAGWLAGWMAAAEQSLWFPGSLSAYYSALPFWKMSFQPAFVSSRVFCAH